MDFGKTVPKEKSIISVLLGNLMLFTVVFSVLGLALKNPLGLSSFGTTFLFFLALGEGLGLFDLVIIDLLWWRNTKRIRFSFLQEKADYHPPISTLPHFFGVFRCLPWWLCSVPQLLYQSANCITAVFIIFLQICS